ncbi:hypothetical protein B7C51_06725 [Paenibacillus larvae subsp. pulvifaciens]|uniref:Uncharacterized protein n=1 Tax=Paenibacillus larvae subsp. pulvifaciens TaxID=1477 RepID=A0A1V0UR18_9BACL|nr:hypothetical protein B7C51_06725 [Paenibacillus larvae subsp. pulvifaciens]
MGAVGVCVSLKDLWLAVLSAVLSIGLNWLGVRNKGQIRQKKTDLSLTEKTFHLDSRRWPFP